MLHGNRTYPAVHDDGHVIETHSISAGLDYPGAGPSRVLNDTVRAIYVGRDDAECMEAFHRLARTEGTWRRWIRDQRLGLIKLARDLPRDALVLCNLSGRGDKDIYTIAAREGIQL